MTDPLRICQWLQDSQFGTALHESTYMFPLIETTHVLGLAVSVGLILMTDLRLVGAFMRDQPVSEVTVAGNLKDMFLNMTPANDLVFRYGVDAPTVRIDGMTLAGR